MEERILAIEAQATKLGMSSGTIPGTQFARRLMDTKLLLREGLNLPEELRKRESVLIWTLAVGGLVQPKTFFNSLTMEGALALAEAALGLETPVKESGQ